MDKRTKHTPGPWKTEGWENCIINAADGSTITIAPGGGPGFRLEEIKANAALIAAAPELLATLEAITERAAMRHPHFEKGSGLDILKQARAAIAKAKGEYSK